ncbi:V-type ATPase subunit E [Chitinivibrio alkaliphilus]|uniref:V-type ATPase, subunit E n=1 Tax=Chitinivibrio alkaliphilus ACht1 TaxID=1313304 RepID=U7DBQ9_9BACT|nr:V-type ATPase subunit E [Chitinivibrio alkaliphilus]ERP31840.1 V-type ATPase, subunit E [Chitinivibrio alkaliphilus ACht1]
MEGKISQLAEKLLNEGVEKGEAEKKRIIQEAQKEAESIVQEAEKRAEKIKDAAEKKAQEMIENAQSEIRLAGNQAVSALKQEITDLIIHKTVDNPVKETLSDPAVMSEYVTNALKNWEGGETSLEVIIPAKMRAEMDKKLIASLEKELGRTITLTESTSLQGGFQIASPEEGYKITFSKDDFAAFFGEYLRPKIKTLLFGE